VNKEAARIDIYTIDGRHVFGIDSPASTVSTSLTLGFYIIEATATDGTSSTKKVRI